MILGSCLFCRLVSECGLNVFCVPSAVLGAEDPEKRTGQSLISGWKDGRLYWQVKANDFVEQHV